MGETTYVMRPVTYTSMYSVREPPKESTMHAALSQSISFGRFMSESLSWEKWSTFTSKKYVEEAERFSQPGSVAEKKAFFEAHYKGMATKKDTTTSIEEAKLDDIKNQSKEDSDTKDTKLCVISNEMETLAEIGSPNRVSDDLDEPVMENKEEEGSDAVVETSVLEEIDTEVELSYEDNEKESGKMESNELEPDMLTSQGSVSSEEALLSNIKEENSPTPTDENIIVKESLHRKKSATRWLKPLRVTPTKEFNFFSLTVKMKPKKSRKSAEVSTNSPKYKELATEPKDCTAIAESKNNPNGSSPSTAGFSQLWNKYTKKLLFSSFRLRNEEKAARRKKEKAEKKPRRWGLTHCFKPVPYRSNYREKERVEEQLKMIAISRP